MGVFFHHCIITWHWKIDQIWVAAPPYYCENLGTVGISVFFMITGFLFTSKLIKDRFKVDWVQLYESRVFRILPLYYFTVILISFIVFSESSFELAISPFELLKQYLRWIIFHGNALNDNLDPRRIIAYVDWTLKYELVFYALLPFIALVLSKIRFGGAFLLIICMIGFLYPTTIVAYFHNHTEFFILFAIGGLLARLRTFEFWLKLNLTSSTISLLTLFYLCASIFYPHNSDFLHISLIALFFVMIALGNDMFGLFSLKASVLLGEISYSIYLLHAAVLYVFFSSLNIVDFEVITMYHYLLFVPFVAIFVVLLSATTFLLIEKPCIHFGRKRWCSLRLKESFRFRIPARGNR